MRPATLAALALTALVTAAAAPAAESRVEIATPDGWILVGDLSIPEPAAPSMPAALVLNRADGTRSEHAGIARELARRGVVVLNLELRGHGESVNRGRFVPYSEGAWELISGSGEDVKAALARLRATAGVDPARIGVVGASYTGEVAMEVGREAGLEKAYVLLSAGSMSSDSTDALEAAGTPWLWVRTRDEGAGTIPAITEIALAAPHAEVWVVPGDRHVTHQLDDLPELAEQIAVWLGARLSA